MKPQEKVMPGVGCLAAERHASARCIEGNSRGGGKERVGKGRAQLRLILYVWKDLEVPKKGHLDGGGDEESIEFQINVDNNDMHKYVPTKSILSWTKKDMRRQ